MNNFIYVFNEETAKVLIDLGYHCIMENQDICYIFANKKGSSAGDIEKDIKTSYSLVYGKDYSLADQCIITFTEG